MNHFNTYNLFVSRNSIRFKLIRGLLLVMIPLISLLIYDNFYAINLIRSQVAESNKNMMSLYMGQIDSRLNDTDTYLNRLAAVDLNLQIMEYTTDINEYTLAKVALSKRISDDVQLNKTIDSFFIYSISNKELLKEFNDWESLEERDNIDKYLTNLLNNDINSNDLNTKGWYPKKINQDYYLFRIFKAGYSYIGAWVNIKKLLIPLNFINLGDKGASLLITDKGEPMVSSNVINYNRIDLTKNLQHYYLTGESNQYLVVGQKSSKGKFSLIALIPNEKVLEKLPLLQQIINFITITSVILIPICFLYIRKILLIPLNRILGTMKKIHDGDLEVRIDSYETSEEFKIVNETFNNMMTQIKELRITVYEEKLNKQKAELKHLQLQINPHFFMNLLNIIYSLAQTGNYKLIQEMTLCLVQYFRYMFKSNLNVVSLGNELKHVHNYIHIQELRFPGSLTCNFEIPETLMDTPIPPLMIQTFIENIVKHAVTLDEPIHIYITGEFDYSKLEPSIKLTITDTGKGFNENILAKIQKGEQIIDEKGEHIGIWNVQQRLKLLYSDSASITFNNGYNPSGAVVTIVLPLQSKNPH